MRRQPPMPVRRTAFSIIELLMVIAIMFLLVTIAVVAFSGAREGANRAASLNALRQMAMGYSSYSTDHNGRLMPGYMDEDDVFDLQVDVRLPNNSVIRFDDCVAGRCDQSSWVWRLAPYLADAWETMYVDYRSSELITKLTAEYEGTNDGTATYGPASMTGVEIGISEHPSFGLNSVFLGGDSAHGGAGLTDRNPWSPADPDEVLAATRISQVINPSHVILFGASQRDPSASGPKGSDYNVIFGSPELRAPLIDRDDGVWSSDQWSITGEDTVSFDGDFAAGGGVPVARHGGGLVPITRLDGSTVTETMERLAGRAGAAADAQRTIGTDILMSLWYPWISPPVASTSEN